MFGEEVLEEQSAILDAFIAEVSV
ncbi:hypothetical protein PL9214640389 [Planktothrix tepida PCC 9214]|uniref:Uncharacterized protein n=2 Tax=Planktothrix TaxID=54304 RepID=A0A1J1LQ73_9CYAN|nr:hypothetical protein PL9214640389 [Planktothrix tepida PCC 9214]